MVEINVINQYKSISQSIIRMNQIIEGEGALVNQVGEEQSLKAGDFALIKTEGTYLNHENVVFHYE